MSSSQASTTSSGKCHSRRQRLLFIDYTPTHDIPQKARSAAQQRRIRAQAARSSSNARLETIRKRAEGRTWQPGVFPVSESVALQEPVPLIAVEQHQNVVTRYRHREASATLHSHVLLGGSIPVAQANFAVLAQFLHRFKSGSSTERPWIELVLGEAGSSSTPSLVSEAFQANATALCANDLHEPRARSHATKLYLSTISRLQSSLNSPGWRDPVVLYTCMILSFYECIQSSSLAAQRAHVSGVAQLIQQTGPQSFTRGLEHKAFRYYRINILMMSLNDRQPTFLAESAWKTIPFSRDCPPKTLLDSLLDILFDIPGILAATEALKESGLDRYVLIQKAFKLACWVRSLTYSLERWKEDYIWTYPAICTAENLKSLDVLALCELGTGLLPYDARLGEALNCYLAAHLILARIAQRMSDSSFFVRIALRPPYSLCELVSAIVLVSEKHTAANMVDMISMIVTTFPLKVAQSTTELHEPSLFKRVEELLIHLNDYFARKYNVHYSVPSGAGAYEV